MWCDRMSLGAALAYIGPALAEGLAFIGTVWGIQIAASVGLSVISENPALRARVYALAAFPMTQTLVYGFIYMFLAYSSSLPTLLSKYPTEVPLHIGFAILGISIMVGMAELWSAYLQGVVCRDGIVSLLKTQGRTFADSVVLAAYEELFGILGMIFGILMLGIIIR